MGKSNNSKTKLDIQTPALSEDENIVSLTRSQKSNNILLEEHEISNYKLCLFANNPGMKFITVEPSFYVISILKNNKLIYRETFPHKSYAFLYKKTFKLILKNDIDPPFPA